MGLVAILEPLLAGVIVVLLITQLLVPVSLGRPILPMFRRGSKLRGEIEGEKERAAEIELFKALEKLKEENDDSTRIQPGTHNETGPNGSTPGERPQDR